MLLVVVDALLFGLAIWMGLYLLGRNSPNRRLWLVSAANLTLAFLIAIETLQRADDDALFSSFGTVPLVAAFIALFALGIDFVRRDAAENGEAWLPDLFRSFDYSALIALLFGGQIVLVMTLSTGLTVAMMALLLAIIATAVASQVFLDKVQQALDRIAFARIPQLREARAELRETASSLPRVNAEAEPLALDEQAFTRHTRRALSHFGDLTRLSTNPLTNLPEIERRIAARGAEPATLERAAELKSMLAEAIEQLKPRTGEPFGISEEWRHYNALYFPYVVGIRPYSQRATNDFDEQAHRDALDWFRTYVPERTLHNWQTAAARLVAQHLREQSGVDVSTETELAATRT